MIMLWFGKRKVPKEDFCSARKTRNIWDVNVNNIVISKLVETKNNSKYLIEFLDVRALKSIKRCHSIISSESISFWYCLKWYVNIFKVKDKDKNKKLMPFRINNRNLLDKYKTIWTKIDDLKDIKLNVLLVYEDGYIKINNITNMIIKLK